MNSPQARAFFVGVLSGKKPLKFEAALKELLKDDEAAEEIGEKALKDIWSKCEAALKAERKAMLKVTAKTLPEQITELSAVGDYFLTGMTVAGTDFEDMPNEEAADLLTEMEDHLLLLDEWSAEGEEGDPADDWKANGEKYKREFLEIWKELEEVL